MQFPRRKSCEQCRSSKTRCDLLFPRCSRCAKKKLQCQYKNARSNRRSVPNEPEASSSIATLNGVSSPNPADEREVGGNPVPETDDPHSRSCTTDSTSLSSISDHVAFIDQIDDTAWLDAGDHAPPAFPTDMRTSDFIEPPLTTAGLNGVYDETLSFVNLPIVSSEDDVGLHQSFSSCYHAQIMSRVTGRGDQMNKNGLLLKDTLSLESRLNAVLIFGQIKRYPKMLIQGPYLPPFIHQGTGSRTGNRADEARRHFLEPLANCCNILRMFFSGSPAGNALIWRTMQAEEKRLHEGLLRYDGPTLLSALQAMIIYLLVQAMEPQRSSQLHALTVTATADFAARMSTLGYYDPNEKQGLPVSWQTWSYYESIRRTVGFMFTIESLLNLVFGERDATCAGFTKVPLPCGRGLWEADTESKWERQYNDAVEEKGSESLTIGAIAKSRHSPTLTAAQEAARPQQLATWCSAVDELGILIWTVARLL